MKKKKGHDELLVNLALTIAVGLFTLILIVVILEIVLRTAEPKPLFERQNEFVFYEYDALLGWKNKAGANGTFLMPDTSSQVIINSRGLREREIPYEKPSGTIRIVVLGDSFIWGYGLNASQRITDTISESIDRQRPELQAEVINMGTTGYDPTQEYLFLREEGIAYDPDIVVLAYHNDLVDMQAEFGHTYPKPHFVIEDDALTLTGVPVPQRELEWEERFEHAPTPESPILKINKFYHENVRAYRFLKERLMSFPIIRKAVLESFDAEFKPEEMRVIEEVILEMKQLTEAQDAQFVLITIPDKNQVYGRAPTDEIDHLVTFSEEHGITHIDLLPELRRVGENDNALYFRIDGHFSAHGSRLVGEHLAEEMLPLIEASS